MLSNDQFVPLHYSGVRGGKVNVEVEKHLQEFKNKESGDQGIVEDDSDMVVSHRLPSVSQAKTHCNRNVCLSLVPGCLVLVFS